MDISIVIPTFRRPELLKICLRCLEQQTIALDRFEVIVVSDGPDSITSAGIRDFLKVTPLQIKYIHTEIKDGPAAARNLGWKTAVAPLVAFTDDDCRPAPDWLSSFLDQYADNKTVVFTGFTRVPLPTNPTDFALNTFHLQTADFITANCACSKSALLKVGGFDERFKTAWREDSDLEFRFLKKKIPIIKVRDAVVVHPVRDAPWGISIKEQKKGLFDALLYKKHPDLYRRRIQPVPLWNYYLILGSFIVTIAALVQGDNTTALVSAGILLILIVAFFIKRIRKASKSPSHIAEMLVTSLIIPFLSIYWRFYGAVKYRVLFF